MKSVKVLFLVCVVVFSSVMTADAESKVSSVLDFTMKSIDGEDVSLRSFKGKVIMIVNVASKCGLTPQYEGLQKLHKTYGEKGLVILGFPANNFGKQEPGTDKEIRTFCTVNYGVEFPMFSKISVKGDDMHALYGFLTGDKTNPKFSGEIKWNFTKFLIDRDGNVINRFEPKTKPESDEVILAIEYDLSEKILNSK